LGGEIRVVSEPGKGSTFTLYLPREFPEDSPRSAAPPTSGDVSIDHGPEEPGLTEPAIRDDRHGILPGDEVLLVIEDDMRFGRVILDLGRESGFKAILAPTGEEAIRLAKKYQPEAITLDLNLPGLHGWSVLDRLKHDPRTRHIPVQVITAFDERDFTLQLGAIGYLQKPVEAEELINALKGLRGFVHKDHRVLLVIEDDEPQRRAIVELIGNGDLHTIAVGTGDEALKVLRNSEVDCVVMDLGLPDMTGFELIERIQHELGLRDLRIVIYTGRELTRQEENELRRVADSIIVKEAESMDRLFEETALFLHRRAEKLPESKRRWLEQMTVSDPSLAGRTVMIIDDDVRNVFALTSLFERYGMKVSYADNAREGLQKLADNDEVEAAFVDIMMPDMDGYEAIRRIRKMPKFEMLPIFALTAKAMKGDREKCLQAGATDYIAKPADPAAVISLLRIHIARKAA
jgi:CheY-like chemotaxis protein